MASIERTAYPRFKRAVPVRELYEAFTPTAGEIAWAREQTRTPEHLLALVVLVKSCHRLEYFPVLAEVPPPVTEHIRGVLELKPDVQARHDSDRTLRQHKSLVRDGYDLVLVAELMGHARTETTRGYSLPTADDAQGAINSLPADR